MYFHHAEIIGEDGKTQKKKKETIQGIKKSMSRKRMFHCLTRHSGKGVRDSLKRVRLIDENN